MIHARHVNTITDNVITPANGHELIPIKTRSVEITEQLEKSDHGDRITQTLDVSYLYTTQSVQKLIEFPLLFQITLTNGINYVFGSLEYPALIQSAKSNINGGQFSAFAFRLSFQFVNDFTDQYDPNIVAPD
jgi:hypothetical protein